MLKMDENYKWYQTANLDKYVGKWVVIINKKVIGSRDNVKEILEKAKRKYPNKIPFLVKVPEKILVAY